MSIPEPPLAERITDILERGGDVSEWPEDERELHRNFIGDFTARRAAVVALRVDKIIAACAADNAIVAGPGESVDPWSREGIAELFARRGTVDTDTICRRAGITSERAEELGF